jgi:molybdopterin converting factor subunit 1
MKVQVQIFAVARERVGRDMLEVELAEPANVGDLRRALLEQWPALQGVVDHLMFAINADYADDRTPLSANSDIAAIPPVSGG